MGWKVPLFDLRLGAPERQAVLKVMRSNWIAMGPATQEFERRVAAVAGVKHALAVSSGTAALHLAFAALGVGPGDEVLCPSLSFVATANAIALCGAKPVFVDIEGERNLHLSIEDTAEKITHRTKAVAIVDYAGFPVDLKWLRQLLMERRIAIVEDAAHSIGAGLGPKRMCGSLGDVGCFSFYSNKNVTTGEGGMAVTSDDALAERIRLLRSHGMTSLTYERHRGHSFEYDVVMASTNYRSDDLRSALGVAQLKRLASNNVRRRRIVDCYRKELRGIKGLIVPFGRHPGVSSCHIMPILLPPGADRHAVMTALRDRGIQTSIHYRPIHTFTHYRRTTPAGLRLPKLDAIAPRLLTLPLYPHLAPSQVRFVVESLRRALQKA